MAAAAGTAISPFLVLLVVMVSAVQPEQSRNCSYHPGTDTVSCMSMELNRNNSRNSIFMRRWRF